MIDARFVTLEKWFGEKTKGRRKSPFGVKMNKLYDDLEREMKHLGARDIVVQAFVSPDDIRNDGWPRSSARFYDPGIIVSFTDRNKQAVSFPCDTFTDWFANLRAISLTLTALRSIDRYGVTKRGEQYAGWKRLAAPAKEQAHDAEWAVAHIARLAGTEPRAIQGDGVAMQLAYRTAAKKTHPDSGGSIEAFQLLQEAVSILRVTL